MSAPGGLKRSLGLWAIVGLGLGYMTPTVLFDTFGIVTKETNGVVPLAYLVALVVMLFTAISYGRMAKVFPSAGSAYTYTREAIHPRLGFMVGWAALLLPAAAAGQRPDHSALPGLPVPVRAGLDLGRPVRRRGDRA
jgi:putrescine importer